MNSNLSSLGLVAHVLAAADSVTEDELRSYSVGFVSLPRGGISLTDEYLSQDLKVLWVLLQREKVRYKNAGVVFGTLRPTDAKYLAFEDLLELRSRAESMYKFFWSNFLWEYSKLCHGHHEVGFDQDFRIWLGSSIRREVNDSTHCHLSHCHYRW